MGDQRMNDVVLVYTSNRRFNGSKKLRYLTSLVISRSVVVLGPLCRVAQNLICLIDVLHFHLAFCLVF